MPSLAEQAVDAISNVFGSHPGHRAVHAKGILCTGTFTATPEAVALTRAQHMQGQPVEVTVRFSNAGGDPNEHDGVPDGRGMATKLYLPDGSRTDIAMVTAKRFFARTPEEFVEFNRAIAPGNGGRPRPRPLQMLWYLARHPKAGPAVKSIREVRPVAGYDRCRYNSLHAYRWVDGNGGARHVRYSWLPEDGELALDSADAMRRSPDYLQEGLRDRFAEGSRVRFTLVVQIAQDGDPLDDPRVAWPDDREEVAVGVLELTGLETRRETGGDVLVFDPTRVTDGIELTDDPILRFRPAAYSVSVDRRAGVPAPTA